ncbi:hypothetical protein OROHE_001806 [Orobanche hederae]
MSGWKSIGIRYGGYWDDNLSYIGGGKSTAYVKSDDMRILESRGGRLIKSLLSSDDELARVCNANVELEVYVTDGGGTSQSEQGVYRPSFEIPSHSAYEYTSQNTSLDESFTHQFSSSDWFVNIPQHMPSPQMQQDVEADTTDKDSDDEDYTEEALPESEEEEERDSALVSYGTFVEFDAWIRQEGGFRKLISTIMKADAQGLPNGVAVEEAGDLNNWLVPVIPPDASVNLFASHLDSVPDPDELSDEAVFTTKNDLKTAVGMWHLERGVEYCIPRSDTTRITFKCRYEKQCPFLLRASGTKGIWCVTKFNAVHTCVENIVNTDVRKVKARVLATRIARKIREDGIVIVPRDIMADVLAEYGVEASYSVALRARNWAIELIYGGH